MNTATNKEIIRKIYAALAQGDRGQFAAHLAPDYVWRFPSNGSWSRTCVGQDEVRDKLLGPLFALFAGPYTARLVGLVAEGEQVVAQVEGHVPLKSGQVYENRYCMIFHFREGKIAEVVEYCDTDHVERVLGPYEDALRAYRSSTTK